MTAKLKPNDVVRAVNRERATRAIAMFLEALGYDLTREDLIETPNRVVAAYADELLIGDQTDLAGLIVEGSQSLEGELEAAPPGLVLVKDITVAAVCPHHLLPALGRASVAYLPGKRLLGLGTVAHVVDACARGLALQESIGERVVQALMTHAGARGALCRLELQHTCMAARGAKQAESQLVTLARGGALAESSSDAELLLAFSSEMKP
ncbi:MAG TPA: GTP cyclohydrolase I [Polyangiaceae bacterium]|nr:GTP cyclohydrolase I [Polyangiaceae bacterium]